MEHTDLAELFQLPSGPEWRLLESDANQSDESDIEARLAISNGAIGMRATLEQPLLTAHPAIQIAGVFQTSAAEPHVPTLLATPDWLRLAVFVDGERVELARGETLTYWRALDLRRGLLLSRWRQRLPDGCVIDIQKLRLASQADRSLAIQVARLHVDRPATVRVVTAKQPGGGSLVGASAPEVWLWTPPGSSTELAIASSTRTSPPASESRARGRQTWTWARAGAGAADQVIQLERMAAIVRSGCTSVHPAAQAEAAVHAARRRGLGRVLDSHIGAWTKRWTASDIELDGDPRLQQALRFAIYHLVSAANPDDEHSSIGARALTGQGYLGHVFWDTDIFLLPFYTLTWPSAARALLMYRYHTLAGARSKAQRNGYRGALYAWESADHGEETTPAWAVDRRGRIVPILCGTQEQHISADVAYAVWRYWQVTRDAAFFREAGAEILLETARFWASRAALENDDRYHIRQVIGPDEYHESVDDNAYTNGLAAWNLERGLDAYALLRARWPRRGAELAQTLQLELSELDLWQDVAARLVTGFDPARGLIEQFAGFFDLEDVDLDQYRARAAPLDVVLGHGRTSRAQIVKQADVVMLHALLPEQYDRQVAAADFGYYAPRCGHGSSLSPSMHAMVAARLGNLALARRYLGQAASIDLGEARGDSALGVHIGALGGLWQAIVFGFVGLRLDSQPGGATVQLDPHLLPEWQRLAFRIQVHGRRLRFECRREPFRVSACLEHGQPLSVQVCGDRRQVWRQQPVVWQQEESTP